MPGFQQPVYGGPMMGQPMPMQNQGNPFGFNGQPVQPQPMYSPTVQGYQYAPAPNPVPQQPAVDVAAPTAPANDTVKVDTAFNA